MAEAFLRKYQGDAYDVHSAGVAPAAQVHPMAVRVMAEVGVDISQQTPKALDKYLGHQPVRHLMIVCDKAGESCPRIWPGTFSRTSLPFDDPAEFDGPEETRLEGFRRVRDEIETAMRAWAPKIEGTR